MLRVGVRLRARKEVSRFVRRSGGGREAIVVMDEVFVSRRMTLIERGQVGWELLKALAMYGMS